MGGRSEHDPDNDDARDITAISNALSLGITHIDSAEAYAAGYSETLVGQAIAETPRSELFLTSKVSPQHFHYDDLLRAHEASLERLGVDYLDLYLLHHPNPEIDIKETMRALNQLVDSGGVKGIGVSNFAVARIQAAEGYSNQPLTAVQAHYNLVVREPEHKGVLGYCQQREIILMAWRPVELGKLSESDNRYAFELTQAKRCTGSQLSIAWLCAQKSVATIFKTSNPKHLAENLGALKIDLSDEEVENLRADYTPQLSESPSSISIS